MSMRQYLFVSGAVFAVVAVLHLVRAILALTFQIGDMAIPTVVSWLGFVIAGGLAASAYRLSRKGAS